MISNKPVISVEGVSKCFRMVNNTQREKKKGLASYLGIPFKRMRDIWGLTNFSDRENQENLFWALKDINFAVKQGEVLGIVGKNGAGKSTLLKILSKITAPTTGEIKIKGRVNSLLEVGTGFNGELSGRENIYMNGTLHGLSKKDIDARLDDIVDFSGVSNFIDMPVKRYSSGMSVRLGFAVAAYLEPEILIIDEILAVGDYAFQKQCLGKMEAVAKEGRTVIFVSHQLDIVKNLCSRCLLLKNGLIETEGDATEICNLYVGDVPVEFNEDTSVGNEDYRRGSGEARFTKIEIQDNEGKKRNEFSLGEDVHFLLEYKVRQEISNLEVSVCLRNREKDLTLTSASHVRQSDLGSYKGKIIIKTSVLKAQTYSLYFHLGDGKGNPFDVIDDLTERLKIKSDNPLDNVGGCFQINSTYMSL